MGSRRPLSAMLPAHSNHLRKIRTSRATYIVEVHRLFARAIGCNLISTGKELGVNSVSVNQPIKIVPSTATAFVALDDEHVEFADQIAENDGAFTRHDNASQLSRGSGAAAMSAAA